MELAISRGNALVGAAVVLVVLFLAGRYLADAGTAQSKPARIAPVRVEQTAAPKLVVHVVGAVRRPGLYRLPREARIADAVAKAGGPTLRADVSLVNLAAPLADGTQVVVPRRAPPVAGAQPGSGGAGAGTAGPVHLNTATLEQLDSLPGIGPVTAQKILDYRQQHGAFASVDDLDAVPGIGPARLEQLRGLVAP